MAGQEILEYEWGWKYCSYLFISRLCPFGVSPRCDSLGNYISIRKVFIKWACSSTVLLSNITIYLVLSLIIIPAVKLFMKITEQCEEILQILSLNEILVIFFSSQIIVLSNFLLPHSSSYSGMLQIVLYCLVGYKYIIYEPQIGSFLTF